MTVRCALLGLAMLTLCVQAGCGPADLKSLSGKVVLPAEETFQFAGEVVELRSQSGSNETAFGEILADGTFAVESLVDGKIVKGVKPGNYQARIVISDDDYEHKKIAGKSIPKKYLSFDSSGLSVQVPSSAVTFELKR